MQEQPVAPDSPRAPWPIRVVNIMGFLFFLAAFLTVATLIGPILLSLSLASWRVVMIALSLIILFMTCDTIALPYRTGVPQIPRPDMGPVALGSWRKQARAIVLWLATPLCALALSIFIPITSRAYQFVFPVFILSAILAAVARLIVYESRRSQRAPEVP
jgi:hypothetical protein